LSNSTRAQNSASDALTIARGARQEADSFETRLGGAEHKADEADSRVSEALKRVVETTTEIERIRLPRTLVDIPKVAERLRQFKGTEYAFTAVSPDDDSLKLLKQIDRTLQLAEWKRGKVTYSPVPALQISGANDIVEIGVYDGVHIVVDTMESLAEIQSTPTDKLPELVKIGDALNNEIFFGLSPAADIKDRLPVEIDPGKQTRVIHIKVGRKP